MPAGARVERIFYTRVARRVSVSAGRSPARPGSSVRHTDGDDLIRFFADMPESSQEGLSAGAPNGVEGLFVRSSRQTQRAEAPYYYCPAGALGIARMKRPTRKHKDQLEEGRRKEKV